MKTIRTSKKTKDEIWVLKDKKNNTESSQNIKKSGGGFVSLVKKHKIVTIFAVGCRLLRC